jgi:diguanylate cyclase (GGDEF)-like protein
MRSADRLNPQPSAEFAARYRHGALMLGLAVLVLAATALYLVLRERSQIWDTAHRNQQDVASAMQSSISELLAQPVFSLHGIYVDLEERIGLSPAAALEALRLAQRFDPLSTFLGIKTEHILLLVDAQGEALSRIDAQALSKIKIDKTVTGLSLGPLLKMGQDDTWYLPVTLGMPPGVSSDGVIFALVPVTRLLAGISSLRLLPGSFVTLFTPDGRRLLRQLGEQLDIEPNGRPVPAQVLQLVAEQPSGSFARNSTLDGRPSIYGYAMSNALPLVVSVGVPESALQAQWVGKAIAPLIILGLGLVAVGVFGLRLRRAQRELRAYVAKQEYMASHDHLTGLPNRYAFLQFVDGLVEQSGPDTAFFLLLIDLNNFKDVNDTLGHAAGDAVLKAVGLRLKALMADRPSCVARLGGDEIAICEPQRGASEVEAITRLCEQIQDALKTPLIISGVELAISASIGVAAFPRDARTSTELLRCADIAMYSAKTDLTPHRRYAETMDRFSSDALAMKAELANAIRDGTLTLLYQPKLRLDDLALIGLEALSRWVHPIKGPVAPSRFMPLAENTELIHPFTEMVLKNAIGQIANWLSRGYEVPVAVNISANNLLEHGFAESLREQLAACHVPAHLLELEVTESAVMRYPELMLQRLQDIRDIGVRLAIDDFGTGYASLAYLKRLPVDTLKIDKVFITNVDIDHGDRRIVKSSIQLAHGFDMEVVAEGVESQAVVDLLKDTGCDHAQGFHFSMPVSAAEIESRWLARLVAARTES